MKRSRLLPLWLMVFVTALMLMPSARPSQAQVEPCAPCAPCPLACPADAICENPLPPGCQPPVQPGVFTDPSWLKIDHHRVSVEIENQIASTSVDLEFVNEGSGMAEGTFIFPLPQGAAVDQLTMYINGQAIDARILPADQARQVYNDIVRQYRDPALLEYIGSQAVQANIFPIPPGDSRRIEIRYAQALEVDNGLIHYVYPLDVTRLNSSRSVDSASISVKVEGQDEISSIYSPSNDIAINRDDDGKSFSAGWEASRFRPDQDFSLYYGIASKAINVNLLTYRESASDEGFFMLMVQPPLTLPEDQITPRDLILVLDQSGSMEGPKWEQTQKAASYVLDHLNPRDRFNVVLFSTGWRTFSNQLESREQAQDAIDWINGEEANGGTNIDGALTTAMSMVDRERSTVILFMTDGLPTEGETNTDKILSDVQAAAPKNARLFSFGVGDDVDTILLDSLVKELRGASSYVRPTERIDEEVASLFNKIGSPVLTNVRLAFGDTTVDTTYPEQPLPDLFAGTQLTVVGRYRGSAGDQTITLTGEINGEEKTFVYDGQSFRERAGGEPFVARLWATRRIGDLLNTIRLKGENRELVDSIVKLSVRYGIITPYTSFLIDENDILSQQGLEEAQNKVADANNALRAQTSGSAAVAAADQFGSFAEANAPAPMAMPTQTGQPGLGGGLTSADTEGDSIGPAESPIKVAGDKTFINQNGVWTDTTFQPDTMTTTKVTFLSDDYFALLDKDAQMGEYLAVGDHVIVVVGDSAYEIVPA